MTIIITKFFKKDFIKIFKEKDLGFFCEKFSSIKEINLKPPYKKYKIRIFNIDIRGIYIIGVKGIYLPIFIVKKSDKKYGMNLVLTKELVKILKLKYEKNLEDIEKGNFEKYDENGNILKKV